MGRQTWRLRSWIPSDRESSIPASTADSTIQPFPRNGSRKKQNIRVLIHFHDHGLHDYGTNILRKGLSCGTSPSVMRTSPGRKYFFFSFNCADEDCNGEGESYAEPKSRTVGGNRVLRRVPAPESRVAGAATFPRNPKPRIRIPPKWSIQASGFDMILRHPNHLFLNLY